MGEWIENEHGERAYHAVANPDTGARVLLLHPWWGLNQPMIDLADRLAGDGFVVLAPDLFDGVVLDTIDDADAHLQEVEGDPDAMYARVQRALDSLLAGEQDPVGVIGFSMGAAYGHWLTSDRDEIGAVVTFYGGLGFDAPEGEEAEPWQWSLTESSPPYLGHFAEEDPYEDEDSAGVEGFDSRLKAANTASAAYLYPGAKHWFFEDNRPEYDSESAELAYQRTVAFLTESLGRKS